MRRIAKARTAAPTMRRPRGLGRNGIAFASLLVLLVFAGIGAPAALANGTVDLTIEGTGSGVVTSTTNGTASPGNLDCTYDGSVQAGACSAAFSGGFLNQTVVTLTAAPAQGWALLGWSQSGASNSARCTTPPQPDPSCQLNLNGNPGPAATVTAIFGPAPDPPVVNTDAASDLGETTATLNGRVNPGGTAVSSCFFEYGTSVGYGAVLPCVPAAGALGDGNEDMAVSAELPPVEPGVEYHYRLVASNLGGTSSGANVSVTTLGEPPCENVDRRLEQGIFTILLPGFPDCMALEMVNPGIKASKVAGNPMVAADGSRVAFFSAAGFGGIQVLMNPTEGDRYVATRDEGAGWATAPTTPPVPGFVRGWQTFGEAMSFSPDLSRWLEIVSTKTQFDLGQARAYAAGLGGLFTPISPLLEPLNAEEPRFGSHIAIVIAMRFRAASADHSRLLFAPGARSNIGGHSTRHIAYLPGDPVPAGTGFAENTYIAELDSGQPSLKLLVRDRDGKIWGGNCGSRTGGSIRTTNLAQNHGSGRSQGAVSADGNRIYFITRPAQPAAGNCATANKLRILKRLETADGPWISELIASECEREAPDPLCATHDGDDMFQGASVDQTKVYFTTNRQLADSDLDGSATECSRTAAVAGCDLYLYDSTRPLGERLTQVSAGETVGPHEAGKDAKVLDSIAAISTDGSRAYFVAEGVLTGPNAEGKSPSAAAGARNLYVYERNEQHPEGRLAFIGSAVAADQGNFNAAGLWGGRGTFHNNVMPVPARGTDSSGNEVGGDGRFLLFRSKAAMTDDDTDGASTDVFRYDAEAETLERLSKAAPGAQDGAAIDVNNSLIARPAAPPGTDMLERYRWVSEDGQTVAFMTAEGLLPGQSNGTSRYYLWRDAGLYSLPGDTSVNITPTLSGDGSTVALETPSRLLPEDLDLAPSVYVVRAGGGFESESAADPCVPDGAGGCQGDALGSPAAVAASAGVSAGNVSPPPRRCTAAAKRARNIAQRAQRLRRQAVRAQRAGNPRRAGQLRRQAQRATKQAQRLSRNAKRCRQDSRRAAR